MEKQQYYISFCHKVCRDCLGTIYYECLDFIKCPVYEAKQDIDYVKHTRWIFNLSISQRFKIQNFKEFHDIYGGLQIFCKHNCGPSSSKKSSKPSPFMVLHCKFINKKYVEKTLQKFGIIQSMCVMICFSNILNKINKESVGLLPFWEHPSYMENWGSIYNNSKIIPTQTEGILILSRGDIL